MWTAVRTEHGFAVHAMDRSHPPEEHAVVLHAPALLVATGAYDRQLPFPGWDLPGVLTAGGLQSLLKGGGVVATAGWSSAAPDPSCCPSPPPSPHAGPRSSPCARPPRPRTGCVRLPLLRDPAKWAEAARYAAVLARHRVPVRTRTAVVAAEGDARVAAVRTASLDGDGRPLPGTERRIDADTVGVGWGFVPQLDLLLPLGCDLADAGDGTLAATVDAGQRTTVPGLYAAGETCGVGGAALAVAEGRLAAVSVLTDLAAPGRPHPRRTAGVRRTAARHRAFARAMAGAHPCHRPGPPG